MKRILLFGLVLMVTACGAPDVYTPAPTPEAIDVIYPSALQPWADKLVNCATKNHQIALYLFQSDVSDTDIRPNDIVLELGQVTQNGVDSYPYQIGWEQIIVVVNKDNRQSKTSNNDLISIISGQVTKWEDGSGRLIQVWVVPEGEQTRTIFDNFVMSTQSVTSEAMLAPDPNAMLEAISKNVDAIGYMTESFLISGDPTFVRHVKILQLESSLEAELYQPVIAITQSEPKGLLRNLLVCLQDNTP